MLKYFFALIILSCPVFSGCTQTSETKINGISYVASRVELNENHIPPLASIHTNFAAIMPFGFIRSLEDPVIMYDSDRQWYGERKEGVAQYIEMLHQHHIKVMVKPQIWIRKGEFTGFLKMNTEEEWKELEENYRGFILTFARVAEESGADIFCIGTELEQFIIHRTGYWNQLISEIKKVYHGKLTYAANWDEYKRIPFWKELDYIGIDAYFPVSESKTPTIEEARAGWEPWKKEMGKISIENNKQILFTEFGYRSVDFAGKEPWNSNREMVDVNLEAQSNLTQALFEALWDEPWMAGGFIWKWFPEHDKVGGLENSQFTPQNKPVEAIIRLRYGNSNK
jgi:hypothetical protein